VHFKERHFYPHFYKKSSILVQGRIPISFEGRSTISFQGRSPTSISVYIFSLCHSLLPKNLLFIQDLLGLLQYRINVHLEGHLLCRLGPPPSLIGTYGRAQYYFILVGLYVKFEFLK
jgi:hypothetical protein